MSSKEDPDWEVVDSLPGERSKRSRAPVKASRFPKIWIGIAIGIGIALLFPPVLASLGLIVRKLISLWWLACIVVVYFYWKKHFKKTK